MPTVSQKSPATLTVTQNDERKNNLKAILSIGIISTERRLFSGESVESRMFEKQQCIISVSETSKQQK